MLPELNKVIDVDGLMLVEHESVGEPSLILMHYVSEFTKQKANVLILSKINPSTKTLIVFDNAMAFFSLSPDPTEAVQFSQRIRQTLPPGSITLLASGNHSHFIGFEDIASAYFRLKLVNRGSGKNVSGVLELEHHPTPFDASTQQHIYHYLVGERSLKLFMPGATQFII
uniref:Uncharacterized protein n=1 Tax=Panagrolaimus sp. ES5 TaxID=591445 RepID=A0AC34GRX7_9BILA